MYFLTFTMPGWMKDAEQGYQELPKCWKNLQQTINRKFGYFVYAAFVEEQHENRDMPHLHIITLTSLPARLNEIALHCGFGFQAQNLLMSGNSASYYVAKYASKNLLYAPFKFRRVRISQVWPRLPDPELPADVLPMLKSETIKQYIFRIAALLDYDVQTLDERFTNYALDICSNSQAT